MLSEKTLDQRVREVLNVKFRMGLFDNPYTGNGALADKEAGYVFQDNFIDKVQSQSIVLLKNQDDILIIAKDSHRFQIVGIRRMNTAFSLNRFK